MNDLLNTLFGLEGLGFGDPGVSLEFARPLDAWVWAIALPTAVGLGALSYFRSTAPRSVRSALGIVRGALLIGLLLVVAGPRLVRPNERIEPDRVLVLADRSASMRIADAGSPGARQTRDAEVRRALALLTESLGPDSPARSTSVFGFADAASEPVAGEPLPEPGGSRTLLGRSLADALRASLGDTLAGVIVVSDGRSFDEVSPATLRELSASGVAVHAVAVGSEQRVPDASVSTVRAPAIAFENDRVPVTVEVEGEVGGALLEIVDAQTDRVLAGERLGADAREVTLPVEPGALGERTLIARLTPAGEDLIAENNSGRAQITLVDRKVRVLYLEGYPRWEYRYLKNLLVREPSIAAATLLVSNRFEYIQEGDAPIERLPDSPEEWAPFDVVILGDLRPELIGERRLVQLRDHIAERGAGLIWIAGTGPTPNAWAESALAGLLPIAVGPEGIATRDTGVTMTRTDAAAREGLFALSDDGGWPERIADPGTGWSLLRGTLDLGPGNLKPTSVVLANALDEQTGEGSPLVVSMRFGAGRSVLVGSDETWRYRYARGERLTERFWIPLIRSFGRESLAGRGASGRLRVLPARPGVGAAVRIEFVIDDQAILEERPDGVRVEISPLSGDARAPVELRLRPDAGSSRRFSATWRPGRVGRYDVAIDDPLVASRGQGAISAEVEVVAPQDELLTPETDHPVLAALASTTGGTVVSASDAASIVEALPNRSRRVPIAPDTASLWDRPVVLVAFFVVLFGEWLVRRMYRLV